MYWLLVFVEWGLILGGAVIMASKRETHCASLSIIQEYHHDSLRLLCCSFGLFTGIGVNLIGKWKGSGYRRYKLPLINISYLLRDVSIVSIYKEPHQGVHLSYDDTFN